MPRLLPNALIAGAALGLLASPVRAGDEPQDHSQHEHEMTKGEKELAKLLEGRVAGEPTSCIRTTGNQSFRIIDETALVYGSGNTIYVNRTKHPEDIDDDEILVIRRFGGTQLCRLDNVTMVDRFSHMYSGVIFLDDFIPYTRVKDESAKDDGEG